MFDEENVLEQPVEQVVEQTGPSPEELAAEQARNKQENNFRELRKKQEDTERKLNAALQLVEEEKLRNQYNKPPQAPQQHLDDDDIPDVGYVKREVSKVQRELADEREKIAAERQLLAQQTALTRLATAHPDYQEVLADRNMDLLRTLKPELMAAIESMPDVYQKGVAAIEAVKAFGIANTNSYSREKDAIQKQAAKPKAVNGLNPSASNSALNQAHNFSGVMDDAERQRVYLEAVRRSRGQ